MSDWNDDFDAKSWESHFAGAELHEQQDEGESDEDSYLDGVSSHEPSDDDLGEAELVEEPPLDSDQADGTMEYVATRLESVGRATTQRLRGIEHEFNSLNLGLEVWLPDRTAELARSVREEPDGTNTQRVAQLGYGPNRCRLGPAGSGD